MKHIYLIVGCSGSGKTVIAEMLENKYGLKSIQSYTTRPRRSESETGHIFVTDEEFDNLTDLVAYTQFDKYRYCATAEQVENNDLYIIDPSGVEYFKNSYKGSKKPCIIYIESPIGVRYERMKKRAIDNGASCDKASETALQRIVNDASEFYDYEHRETDVYLTVVNDGSATIEAAADRIYEYIIQFEGDDST